MKKNIMLKKFFRSSLIAVWCICVGLSQVQMMSSSAFASDDDYKYFRFEDTEGYLTVKYGSRPSLSGTAYASGWDFKTKSTSKEHLALFSKACDEALENLTYNERKTVKSFVVHGQDRMSSASTRIWNKFKKKMKE